MNPAWTPPEPVVTSRMARGMWHMVDDMITPYAGRMAMAWRMVDVSRLHECRLACTPAPSWTSLVVKAVAHALERQPELNRAILGPPGWRRLVQFPATDVAVALEVPTPDDGITSHAHFEIIRQASARSAQDITQALAQAAQLHRTQTDVRWRMLRRLLEQPRSVLRAAATLPFWSGRLWAEHRGSACFVNSPARHGADLIITHWPWPLTVTFGRVEPRALVVDGQVCARMSMPLGISFDRRVMGGGPAVRALALLADCLAQADPHVLGSSAMPPDAAASTGTSQG